MSINAEHRQYEELDAAIDAATQRLLDIMKEGDTKYAAQLQAERKRRQPRKRVYFDPLPDEFTEPLKEALLAEYQPRIDAARNERQALQDQQDAITDKVHCDPLDDQMALVDKARSSSWATQGYGANKYARASLLPLKEKLEKLGYTTHLREVDRRTVHGTGWRNDHFSIDYADYELWANCTRTMAECVTKLITLGDVIAVADTAGLNRVVMAVG